MVGLIGRLRNLPYKSIMKEASGKTLAVTKFVCVLHVTNTYLCTFALAYGPSMIPTFNLTGDMFLAERLSIKFGKVSPGDIVLLRSPESPRKVMVKRLLGLESHSVTYVVDPMNSDRCDTIVVPKGHVWVEGDNIYNSRDSRQFGPVPYSLLEGKVFCKLSEKLLYGKAGDVKDASRLYAFTSRAGISNARENSAAKDRIFAPYSVYKGKAALSVTPLLPTFTKLDSGSLVVDRRGAMMMKFLPAIGERKYDNEKRQLFALSPTEVGSMISLGPKDSCEFFHDPSMLSSNAGQVRKSLTIKAHADGTGYLISLNVVNNILKTKEFFTVPVTTAEFAVMKTACSFALPHILGWDRLTNHPSRDSRRTVGLPSKVDPQFLDSEWDK